MFRILVRSRDIRIPLRLPRRLLDVHSSNTRLLLLTSGFFQTKNPPAPILIHASYKDRPCGSLYRPLFLSGRASIVAFEALAWSRRTCQVHPRASLTPTMQGFGQHEPLDRPGLHRGSLFLSPAALSTAGLRPRMVLGRLCTSYVTQPPRFENGSPPLAEGAGRYR